MSDTTKTNDTNDFIKNHFFIGSIPSANPETDEALEAKETAKAILNDYLEDPEGRNPFDVLDEIASEYDGDIEDLIGY